MDARENWLRAIEYRFPQWIPCQVSFLPSVWKAYAYDLEEIVLSHPRLFPTYEKGSGPRAEMAPTYRKGECITDSWGCVWRNVREGNEGQVIGHPLGDWAALASYRAPDPLKQGDFAPRDWPRAEQEMNERRRKGLLCVGSGERLFDRLYFLRGYENLMMDIALESPNLLRLIDILEEYETKLIGKWLEIGVDCMAFHTDIGTQRGLMISPDKFRKLLKPMFTRLFQTCRRAGVHVHLSSDGRLVDIVDDLVECGVSYHDPQLRANTLEGIVAAYKGKLAARVDLDRQGFPFMTPQQVREQVKQVVDSMAMPEGGLIVSAEASSDDVPLRNIEAICEAMELYCFP